MLSAAERHAHLLAIVANATKAHKQWVETSDAKLLPEDELYVRLQELGDQAKVIYRPNSTQLEQLILAFAPHWASFVSAQQTTADATMLPSVECWAAWEAIETLVRQAQLPRLKSIEPVGELRRQDVPPRQICQIYGFLDDAGNPDFLKLEEEIKEPGKHTGPNTGWVAPVNRELQARIHAAQTEAATLSERRNAKIAAAVTPAKESIEQLVAADVSAVQIAKLKRMTTDDVYRYCDEHGLPRPRHDYTQALQMPGPHDPPISPERQHALDTLGQDNSPQRNAPRHPMLDTPQLGPAGDGQDDDEPIGVDLSDLPPEEANAIQEAVTYHNSGMSVGDIATNMDLHGNKVRALLKKGGVTV